MPLYIYASEKPEHEHEIDQLKKIIETIDEIYGKSDQYCYLFFNVKYNNSEKLRQYDALIFTKRSISVIELKSMAGSFQVSQDNEKRECNIFQITTPNNKVLSLKWNQIYHQHSYLTNYFGKAFTTIRNKNNEKYRIDNYLVFNDPLIIKNKKLHVTVEHWLTICSINNFKEEFLINQKDQPFLLTEDDIRFLAKVSFGLHLRKKNDIFTKLKSPLKHLKESLEFFDDQYIYETLNSLIDELNIKYEDETDYLVKWKEKKDPYKRDFIGKKELHKALDKIHIKDLDNKIIKLLDDRFSYQLVRMNEDILLAYNDLDKLFINSIDEIYRSFQIILNKITYLRDVLIEEKNDPNKIAETYYNRFVLINFLNVFMALKNNEI